MNYSLFDTLLEPCFVLDSELNVVYCNETAAIISGMSLRKVCRHKFNQIFTFEKEPDWLSNINLVKDPTSYLETRFTTTTGNTGKVQITCQPINSQWIVFVRDVTLEERLQNKYRGELEQKEEYIAQLQQARAELEKYNKNLEKIVEERTAEIQNLNRLMQALLDSLHQGFFVFNRDGLCADFSSKACENMLGTKPNNKYIWDVLKVPENKKEGFKKWMHTLFSEMLPFEDLAPLGPTCYPHHEGRNIRLEYYSLRNEGTLDGVVVVATDVTDLVRAQEEAERQREQAQLMVNLIKQKKQLTTFVREAETMLKTLKNQIQSPLSHWDTGLIFRALHTLKGGAASFNVYDTARSAHEAEGLLSRFKEDPSEKSAMALKQKCEEVSEKFGQFREMAEGILGPTAITEERRVDIPTTEIFSICRQISFWSKGAALAQQIMEKYILEPAVDYFKPYDQTIQAVATAIGKKIKPLCVHGGEVRIWGDAYSPLFSSLVHAFRNSADHGIESPELRRALGKDEAGQITVRISQEAEHLHIAIIDDGGGIDPNRIRKKLTEKGINSSHETDQEVIQHIFDANFSTRESVTDISGRGVGMDAIREAAAQLGGNCWVQSTVGKGTEVHIRLPWITPLSPALRKAS
ncbi:MAG: ATP-binding protein [Bdellovibrionaceae bacterium]|nr:ATP-binding protein [Pseudobdellovibrionaceae bacterium]